ncbi:MAG: hypothetical protein JO116_05620 [Planctomycetaceae bacterium]|nr:hypothetical protein [Planctomycetaceae bacterium]
MTLCRSGKASLSRLLLVACAILGVMLDVVPTPTPGFPIARRLSSADGSLPVPRPDDVEQDETPDEASDLAWPQLRLVLRRGGARSPGEVPGSLGADRPFKPAPSVASGCARYGSRPGSPTFAIDLPLHLCRLTC